MWLHEDWREVVYHGRVRLDSAAVSSFALWVRSVLSAGHKPQHEFRLVSAIPTKVMQFPFVAALNPSSKDIFVSDVLVRHSVRGFKSSKGTALSQEEVESLPEKIAAANWYFDKGKKNLLVTFDVSSTGHIGKAAIHINYIKHGAAYNAVVTSGISKSASINWREYDEIK